MNDIGHNLAEIILNYFISIVFSSFTGTPFKRKRKISRANVDVLPGFILKLKTQTFIIIEYEIS